MAKVKCDRCGKLISGRTEYDLEVALSIHTCKNKRDLDDLPFDILRRLAYGKITEAEAWAEADGRKA